VVPRLTFDKVSITLNTHTCWHRSKPAPTLGSS
jgi:hypothetical protein